MDGIQAPFGFWDPFGFAAEVSHSSGLALLSVFARRPPFHPPLMLATVAVPNEFSLAMHAAQCALPDRRDGLDAAIPSLPCCSSRRHPGFP
jgi:hypothetical protein